MKKLVLVFLLAGSSAILADDNILQNGDFSDGIAHWYGDCHTIADMTSQEDYQAPASGGGVVVKLRAGDWTKLNQDFETKSGKMTLTVTYLLSPGLTFSQRPEDYTNTTGAIGYTAWAAYATPVGRWVVLLCDIAAGHANAFDLSPKVEGATPQTFTASFLGKSDQQKTVCLAFPPGHGFVTLQEISITSSSQ